MRVVYDQEMMGLINLVSRITRSRIKDCFKEGDTLYCIVEKGDIGKAIGRQGQNIKKISFLTRKKIQMIEFEDTALRFVSNLIYPIKVNEIKEEERIIQLVGADKKTKSLLIGRDGKNLKLINKTMSRFYDVEVKVI